MSKTIALLLFLVVLSSSTRLNHNPNVEKNSVVFFKDTNFRGPSWVVRENVPNMALQPFTVAKSFILGKNVNSIQFFSGMNYMIEGDTFTTSQPTFQEDYIYLSFNINRK